MGSLLAADPLLSSGFSHQTCIKHFSVCQAFPKNYFTLVPTSRWVGGCGWVGGSLLHFQMRKLVPREGKELAWDHAVPVQTALHPRRCVKNTHQFFFLCQLPHPPNSPMSVLNDRCLGSTLEILTRWVWDGAQASVWLGNSPR